ncbi:MAG TPA: ATP-dependent sacrificial sulfur transferase LarE [Candidatus Bathyarchaeia archaeon]|nr:ATP-dependent sacrificial sulfur transferase LarE [Candidatus Bathyarchaeia archaeon]
MKELCAAMYSHESALVAFSGGVDSSVVATLAKRALGDAALAVTVDNGALHYGELEHAAAVARAIGIKHRSIVLNPLNVSEVESNCEQRCYHCKKLVFQTLRSLADNLHLNSVMDGTNASDLTSYRPGLKALQELGVVSPLIEVTKDEVRNFARELGLPNADAPSVACLLTAFPYGTTITSQRIERVREAERALKAAGITKAKLKDHNGLARIEVDVAEAPKVIANSSRLAERFKTLGFSYLTLDLEWFRSGSMDVALR